MAEYWWVNQGRTYEQERRGGYMWAPKFAPNGQTKNFWTRMQDVEKDDVVLHYSQSHLRAVGLVVRGGYDASRPSDLPDDWNRDGWRVDVKYFALHRPIRLGEIPMVWREGTKEEPFNIHGQVKQGYLYPLSATFWQDMNDRFGDVFPDLP